MEEIKFLLEEVSDGVISVHEANIKLNIIIKNIKEEFGHRAFYDGREIERYNEHGLAIFKRPTYNGYLRELKKRF